MKDKCLSTEIEEISEKEISDYTDYGFDYTAQRSRNQIKPLEHSETFSPPPAWEGMKGRGDQMVFILSTPTLTLPHRRGRGKIVENLLNKNFKILHVSSTDARFIKKIEESA
jgi:hypothetical protein